MNQGSSKNSNLSLFHSALKSRIENGNPNQGLASFRQLLQSGAKPNDLTFSLVLKSLASSASSSPTPLGIKTGAKLIQTHLVKLGIDRFVYVGTALLDLFTKIGYIDNARKLFDVMPERDAVSWNALICGYSRNGFGLTALEVFVEMLREGFRASSTTLVGLVPSCGCRELLSQGRSVHGFGVKSGLDLEPQVQNTFTSMYAKCGDLASAKLVFEEMEEKSVVSWNTMIGAYGQNGCFNEAMVVFTRMMRQSVEVNVVTIIALLSANADPRVVHCYAFKTGLANDGSVITSLVCVYAKQGSTESAELLFTSSLQKSLVAMTAIVSSYAEVGNMGMVMDCFARMQRLDMKLDSVSMISIVNGISDSNLARGFHCYGLKNGLVIHTLVANGLITMYSKLDDLEAASSLFAEMQEKHLTSWNSVISGCVQAGRARDALHFFGQMRVSAQDPDCITLACLLTACSQLGCLKLGTKFHNYIVKNAFEIEDFLATALVDMYTKCGSIAQAERVFSTLLLRQPCLATWNTMISGYSLHGLEHEALSCYSRLLQQGLKPDRITMLGVLAACVHGGLVREGKEHFITMTERFRISPDSQHCACMVALLGRAGLFDEALSFIDEMDTEPDSAVWGALLAACCLHHKVRVGEYLAKKMFLLDQGNGGLYVLMSNLYAAVERWDDVARVRELMKEIGGDGCSGASQIV